MSKYSFFITLGITLLLIPFFIFYSQVDLDVSHYFFSKNNTFLLAHINWVYDLRQLENIIFIVLVVSWLGFLIKKIIKPTSGVNVKLLIYALMVFVFVPGLVVNITLKNHYHRPRPYQVQEFAGTKAFVPAWVYSDECDHNCSLVCGDSAFIFTFWLFIPFIRRRRLYACIIGLIGFLYGFIRVAAGAHFFSDVIFSALVSYLGIYSVYWFFYRYQPKWLDEARLVKPINYFHSLFNHPN